MAKRRGDLLAGSEAVNPGVVAMLHQYPWGVVVAAKVFTGRGTMIGNVPLLNSPPLFLNLSFSVPYTF